MPVPALGRDALLHRLRELAVAAEATHRRLADDYPSELDYKTGLGWALLKQGKGAEAKAVFEGVLAVSPDNVSARAGVGAR